jgi:hypothetical protein
MLTMDEYQRGRLSLAVEVVQQIRLFRGAAGNSLLALNREEIISVLETFLRLHGLWDEANAEYERQMVATKTVGFEPENVPAPGEPGEGS